MKLSEIKPNPENPRLIRDERFRALIKSIQEFPKMMELRPIVVNDEMVILGGNMRYKALKELGMKEIPDSWVKKASQLTENEQRRFIAIDNVPFGDWDIPDLLQNWNQVELKDWGVETIWYASQNVMTDEDVNIDDDFDPIGNSAGFQRVVFIFQGPEEAESYLKSQGIKFEKRNMAWQVNMSTQSI